MANDVFIQTLPDDPLIEPVIAGLFDEYRRRYGNYFGDQEQETLDLYAPPQGAFIVLLRAGEPIAMGAFKRYDPQTAELSVSGPEQTCADRGWRSGYCNSWKRWRWNRVIVSSI